MANKTPVFFDGGFGVYGGDDTIHQNYTEQTGNILTLEKGGGGNEVLQVLNKGELKVKSVASASSAAITADAISGQDLLTLNDAANSDHLLTVRKVASGASWLTDFLVRDKGDASNDSVALRITHDIRDTTPPQGADLLSIGYTENEPGVAFKELFAMKQSGDFYLQGSSGADILWGTTGGGNIGGSGGNSPEHIYANNTVNANGSILRTLSLVLGPQGATDKTIIASQASTSPYIKYVNGSSKWQFSNDGVTPLDFGTSNVGSWDDLFALSQTMDLDGDAPLTWTQTDVSGYGFILKKTVTTAANALMKIETTAGYNTAVPLLEVHRQAFGNAGVALSLKGYLEMATLSPLGTNKITSVAPLEISTSGSTGSISIKTAGNNSDITLETAATITPSDIFITSRGQLYMKNTGTTADVTIETSSKLNLVATESMNITCAGGNWALGTANFVLTHGGATNSFIATLNGGGTTPNKISSVGNFTLETTAGTSQFLINSGKNLTVSTAQTFRVNVSGDSYDIDLGVVDSSTSDILFSAHGAVQIPFNADGADSDLVGFTATSVIGALNEVNAGLGNTTLDQAYNNDAGSASIAVDAGSVTWNLSGAYVTQFTKALSASPGGAAYSVKNAISSSANLASGDDLVAYYGRAVGNGAGDHGASEVFAFMAIGDAVTGGTSYGFHADANCDYGLYSASEVFSTVSVASGTVQTFRSLASSTGMSSAGSSITGLRIGMAGHATDSAGNIWGVGIANFTGNGGTLTEAAALKIGSGWDYSLYANTRSYTQQNIASGSGSDIAVSATILTDGNLDAGKSAAALTTTTTGHAGDTATSILYGVNVIGGTVAVGQDSYALYVAAAGNSWRWGLYTTVKNYAETVGPSAASLGLHSPFNAKVTSPNMTSSSAVGVGMRSEVVTHTSDVSGSTIAAFDAEIDLATSGPGRSNRTAYNVGATYGYFDETNGEPCYAIHSKGGQAYFSETRDGGFGGNTYTLVQVSPTSTGLGLDNGDTFVGHTVTLTPDSDDDSGSQYFGYTAAGSTTGAAGKIGFIADSNWVYGFKSLSRVTIDSNAPNGVGATGHWSTFSKVATDTFLAQNDVVAAFRADIEDHASDVDQSAHYYGLYISTSDVGPATKRGVFIDSSWPDDQFATWIESGLHFWQEDFGIITATTPYVDFQLSGSLNSTNEGRCLNLHVSPDASQADGSRWIGVRANMNNANANDAIGSIAFQANANWHYGLYVENNLTTQQAPGEGTIHIESLSSSAVSSGTYYGNTFYHTRHASDTAGGTLWAYKADSNNVTGLLGIGGFWAGPGINTGFYSQAVNNVFTRADDLSGSALPVVNVENLDNDAAGGAAAALKVKTAYTGSSSKAIEIDHAYTGSNIEGTRRAIVFSSAKTNRRHVPNQLFQPHGTSTTTNEFWHETSSTSSRWRFNSSGNDIAIPIMAPHVSVLQKFVCAMFGTISATQSQRPRIYLYRHNYSQTVATLVSGPHYPTTSGAGTHHITMDSIAHTVDNDIQSLYVRFDTNVATATYLMGAYFEYDITDLGAAPGY